MEDTDQTSGGKKDKCDNCGGQGYLPQPDPYCTDCRGTGARVVKKIPYTTTVCSCLHFSQYRRACRYCQGQAAYDAGPYAHLDSTSKIWTSGWNTRFWDTMRKIPNDDKT